MIANRIVKEADVETLAAILNTFSQLDDLRWHVKGNYNLINYCYDDLTSDEKLLTHWLSYICDRQTPFERIWEVGGYVISHMVRAFSRGRDKSVRKLFLPYVREDDRKRRLQCPLEESGQYASKAIRRLSRYDGVIINEDDRRSVVFASRFLSDDLVRMYRTLEVLAQHYDRSFIGFIVASFSGEVDYARAIQRMATELDRLTYPREQFTATTFDDDLAKVEDFARTFAISATINRKMDDRNKRLWCCVRDYLKSPEFNATFVGAMGERHLDDPKRWNRTVDELKRALCVIELPGDVWNKNKIFRDGLFAQYLSGEAKSLDMPRAIRKVFDEIREEKCDLRFYPEQLGVTFDFVPRMCARNMCDVCLFGGGIEKLCHKNRELLCPVALVSCGYEHECDPPSCRLKEDLARSHCKTYADFNST